MYTNCMGSNWMNLNIKNENSGIMLEPLCAVVDILETTQREILITLKENQEQF